MEKRKEKKRNLQKEWLQYQGLTSPIFGKEKKKDINTSKHPFNLFWMKTLHRSQRIIFF